MSLPESECIPSSPLRTAMLRFLMKPYWSMRRGRYENCFQLVDSFPIDLHTALQDLHCFDSFLYWGRKPPGRDDAKLVLVSCLISTASCTFTLVSETTCPFTMVYTMYSESDWCVSGYVSGCGCFCSSVKIRSLSSRSSSHISLPSSFIAIAR